MEGYRNRKVLSVAGGPVDEIKETILKFPEDKTEYLALDHDKKTIEKAVEKINSDKFTYGLMNVFDYINKSDGSYVVDGQKRTVNPNGYSLVYSAGLYDYLPLHAAIILTRNLFQLVEAGGELLIGNFSEIMPEHSRAEIEVVVGWHLLYRTKKEIMKFASLIPKGQIASLEVIQEDTGINYFLKIIKSK